METATPKYLDGASTQTLGEGIAEYYEYNSSLLDPTLLPDDVAALFRQHDAGHVIFGCDTSLRGETLIDTWTIFGTSAGIRVYLEYFKHPQVNQIFAEVGYGRIFLEFCRCLPDVVRVLARSRRVTAKWPWEQYSNYLDRPLSEIRSEFNIQVV